MHPPVTEWVTHCLADVDLTDKHVLEVGSYNVNGTVRPLFDGCRSYYGIDIRPGPGVDLAVNAAWWYTSRRWDIVVCTEVLEHVREWKQIVQTCCVHAQMDGMVIITCATDGRPPHGAEGDPAPKVGEYYANIDRDDLELEVLLWCDRCDIDVAGTDLRVLAWR
jgi:hypothetical protein